MRIKLQSVAGGQPPLETSIDTPSSPLTSEVRRAGAICNVATFRRGLTDQFSERVYTWLQVNFK